MHWHCNRGNIRGAYTMTIILFILIGAMLACGIAIVAIGLMMTI
jgi:hypothetical protein